MNPRKLHRQVAGLFVGAARRTTRVAVEQELLVADERTGGTVPVEQVRRACASAQVAACVGYEPGGQLELSLPCEADAATLERRLGALTDDLRRHLATAGLTARALPVDPRPEAQVPLRLTSRRYLAMQAHFDTIGPSGRRMMRRTASTQVCLDWWPGAVGLEQWRLLNLAAPFLAAAFARSSGPEGRLTTWLAVDPARTAYDDRLLRGDDPVAAYTRMAAGATDFLGAGPADHLTTMFPPVRPRGGYLEVRFLDVQEVAVVGRVVHALAGLLYDDEQRRSTLRRLEPEYPRLAEHWRAAAAGDPATATCGRELARCADLEPAR